MGAKLTAGVLGGTLAVVLLSAFASVQVLGEKSVGTGDAAALRYAVDSSTDVAGWLAPPDAEKYSAKQLVAALLAARAAEGSAAIPLSVPDGATGALTALPVAWRGSTTSTSGARVTVRIDVDVTVRVDRFIGTAHDVDSAAARCFVYTVQSGHVTHVRSIRCPPLDDAMKPPKPAPLPTT
ncbi:MAG TPA: hypothetical protein VNR62_06270 [Cellulomonas sp.]|nr:hypothetical protein [Cellulomonas sp.]